MGEWICALGFALGLLGAATAWSSGRYWRARCRAALAEAARERARSQHSRERIDELQAQLEENHAESAERVELFMRESRERIEEVMKLAHSQVADAEVAAFELEQLRRAMLAPEGSPERERLLRARLERQAQGLRETALGNLRRAALAVCHGILDGRGFDRESDLGRIGRGSIAIARWDDPLFTLGLEYGALLALVRAFDLDLAGKDARRAAPGEAGE